MKKNTGLKLRFLVLFAAVLLFGLATGFNLGYDSGLTEAGKKAKSEYGKLYQDFIRNMEQGNIFRLWGVKVVPTDTASLRICRDGKFWAGAKDVKGTSPQDIRRYTRNDVFSEGQD